MKMLFTKGLSWMIRPITKKAKKKQQEKESNRSLYRALVVSHKNESAKMKMVQLHRRKTKMYLLTK
jgi:hypothetical protein